MDERRLGQTDITITPIGLGCWQFQQGKGMTGMMWSVLEQATMDEIVSAALRGGVTWFDTAQAYGQRRVGARPGSCARPRERGAGWCGRGHQVAADPQAGERHRADHRREDRVPRAVSHRPVPGAHPVEQVAGEGADARDGRAGARRQGARRRRQQLLGEPDGQGRSGAGGRRAAARLEPGAHQPAGPLDRVERGARGGPAPRRDPHRLLAARAGRPHGPVPRRPDPR